LGHESAFSDAVAADAWTPALRGFEIGSGQEAGMLLLILILILLLGGGGGYYRGWYGPYNHERYGHSGLGGIIVLVIVIWLVLFLLGGGGLPLYPHRY
jgi:hypothetical protein